MTLTFLKNADLLFEDFLSIWVCLKFSHSYIQVVHPWWENLRSEAEFFLVHHLRRYIGRLIPITDHVPFYCLIKVVSAKFSIVKLFFYLL